MSEDLSKYASATLRTLTEVWRKLSEKEKSDSEFLANNFNQTAIKRKVQDVFSPKGLSNNQIWSDTFQMLLEQGFVKEVPHFGSTRRVLVPTEEGLKEGRQLLELNRLPHTNDFGLAEFEIIKVGQMIPEEPGTRIEAIVDFLNLARSHEEQRLLIWTESKSQTFNVGFYYQGKLFRHSLGEFDNLQDYIEAKSKGIRSREQLAAWREGRGPTRGWPDQETIERFWDAIRDTGKIQEDSLLAPLRKYQDRDPAILPEYEPLCQTELDWRVWLLAKANGWPNFKIFQEFFLSKLTIDFRDKPSPEAIRLYLAGMSYEQAQKDWLQGWPSFTAIGQFWQPKREQELPKWLRSEMREEMSEKLSKYRRFYLHIPLPQYGQHLFDDTHLIIWIVANEHGWSSFQSFVICATEKVQPVVERFPSGTHRGGRVVRGAFKAQFQFRLREEQRDKLLFQLAKLSPEVAKTTKVTMEAEDKPIEKRKAYLVIGDTMVPLD